MIGRAGPVRLAIEGLPTELRSLKTGGMYAILADQRSVHEALAIPTLVDALEARQPVLLVSPFAGRAVLEAVAFAGLDVSRLLRKRRLRLLKIGPDGARRIQPFGMPQVLDEFDHYGVIAGGVIIAAPADALFPADGDRDCPDRGAGMMRQWLRATQTTLLAMLENPDQTLLTEGDFDGVARLRVVDGEALHWRTDFWRLPDGGSISAEYPLRRGTDGRLAVDTPIATGDSSVDARAAEVVDQSRVIVTTGVVRGEKRVPAQWERTDNFNALLVLAGEATAANCVLESGAPNQFQNLARSVHQLRQRRGPALKIIVYETGARLRRSQEQLLLAIGANAVVIGRDFDRLQSVIGTLRDQRYGRAVPVDFDEAFNGSLPQTEGGYLPQRFFCAAALDAGSRATPLRLESVLVQMVLRPDVTPLAALQALQVDRQGDCFSYVEGSVWLFLFGCWESDAERVVTRLVRRPIGELYSALVWHANNADALKVIDALRERIGEQVAEDYTRALAPGAADAESSKPPGHALMRDAAARGVVSSPLTLKQRP